MGYEVEILEKLLNTIKSIFNSFEGIKLLEFGNQEVYTNFDKVISLYNRYGYFENNKLISFVCIRMFENTMRGKFWVIPGLYTRDFKNYFNFKNSKIGELINYAFNYTESMGWYEYYYCTAERVMNVYERQWKRSHSYRYEHILLDVVPPNTKPFYELHWRLMGQEVKPVPTVVKKRVLKQEFRK
jgi:hypothetical protein